VPGISYNSIRIIMNLIRLAPLEIYVRYATVAYGKAFLRFRKSQEKNIYKTPYKPMVVEPESVIFFFSPNFPSEMRYNIVVYVSINHFESAKGKGIAPSHFVGRLYSSRN
jgi:hypothetical protein